VSGRSEEHRQSTIGNRQLDRMQIIDGVTATPLDGQMLRLEVLRVTTR
jgi:hypothetical protein